MTAWAPHSTQSPLSEHITIETLAETVFERAQAGGHTGANLSVIGQDLQTLAVTFEAVILECIR